MQTAALLFTALAPLVLWWLCRRFPSPRFAQLVRRTLAAGLIAFEVSELVEKWRGEASPWANALPMHLCDWVLIAVALSLWARWQLGFELGYFWGLAGTMQALLTPAIDPHVPWWRLFVFFFVHALIVVSVVHLLITERCRPWPQSLFRVVLCSELYVGAALSVNALSGGNYGFLSAKPIQASMLDLFSDTPWLYVLQINLTAVLAFFLLYLPWFLRDLIRPPSAPTAAR